MFSSFKFPRQVTRFTCGPATLAAVSNLLGKPIDEKDIVKVLNTQDVVGTSHQEMEQWASDNLPVRSMGSDTYENGLAIANIRNKDSGKGHYVLFLGKSPDELIRYYCPLLGKTITTHLDELDWKNGSGDLVNWSINFDVDGDFYDLEVYPQAHSFFLGDPLEALNMETDTSLLLKDTSAEMDIETSWHTMKDVFIRGKTLYLSGVPVFENDIVWLRFDPTNSVKYYVMLQQLCHVNALFLNSPSGLLNNNDKKLANDYRKESDIFVVTSEETLDVGLRHLTHNGCDTFVIKPPNLFGGIDIVISKDQNEIKEQALKILDNSGCAVLERFIQPSTSKQIDTSVIITWDRIIGAISREASESGSLTPYHCGSIPKEIKGLSSNELRIVSDIQKIMNEKGIFWAGLNFLEEELIEVNVSCPGGLKDMNKIYNKNLAKEVIASSRKFALGTKYHHSIRYSS